MEALKRLTPSKAVLEALQSGAIRNESSLQEFRQLLHECGLDAQPAARLCIHVAGTKGKGGVCAMLERLFRLVAGCRTALFTSPHLVHPGERIRIDGLAMGEADLGQIIGRVEGRVGSKAQLSYFRMLLLAFYERLQYDRVDLAIIEVGIGGRYDATNVLPQPSAAVITSLGLDHTALLGASLASIARHKAGIIKAGCPVYTIPQAEEAMRVIEEEAQQSGSQLHLVEEEVEGLGHPNGINAAMALRLFLAFHPDADRDRCLAVLRDTRWPGRQHEVQAAGRRWFLDGAHTIESLQAVLAWMKDTGPCELWFHCSADRDWKRLLGVLLEGRQWTRVLLVPPPDAACSHYAVMAEHFVVCTSVAEHFVVCTSVAEAVEHSTAGPVLVTGSLHLVGALLAHLSIPVDTI